MEINFKFWEWGKAQDVSPKMKAFTRTGAYTNVNTYAKYYDGEKNLGELGPAIDYYLNFSQLRIRSWQSFLESEISQTVLSRFALWVVDTGLKLQAQPNRTLLELEGITLTAEQTEQFNKDIEARFAVWAGSKKSSWSGMLSLHGVAQEAYKNAKIGGDVLVVLRYKDGMLKVELIDGAHVSTPVAARSFDKRIRDGVEMDENGKHLRYHVKKQGGGWESIEAVSKSSGFTVAFLVYGTRFRLDSHRGMPVIAPALETLKKLERYKEAAVGSAEERQKIVYFIKHGVASDGRSPLADQIADALNIDGTDETTDIPEDYAGTQLADKIAVSTNKQVFNMTQDSELQALDSKNEIYFKEFYGTNADIICGAVGIPPNIAFSLYNNSFSASRAATKDFDHTILVERDTFTDQFYQPIYDFFQYIQILENKVQAPGYLVAHGQGNYMVTEAYQMCRFTGPLFPHIDPVKEVNAERLKMGPLGANIPLTTTESATEALNSGDSQSNMEQFSQEIKEAESLGLKIVEPEPSNNPPAD